NDKVLYITDSLESEDAFYMHEHGQLVKQRGYFVYYTKNEAMQNYIIKQRGGSSEEKNSEIHRKDEELIKNYRKKNEANVKKAEEKTSNNINLLYVASSFVVLAVLAMGITVISNYDKMKDMQVSINRLEITADEDGVTDVMAETDNNDNGSFDTTATIIDAQTEAFITEETSYINDGTYVTDNDTNIQENDSDQIEDITENNMDASEDFITEAADTTEDISIEQSLPAMNNTEPEYYTIIYGDTLTSIAYERYGSIEFAKNIAEANNLDDGDKIYEGQKIIIPYIE
ncbi:MAG: LysM peptidoglycan-binding domain-containing protein, partial [Lachnospiraceae bacterium]|nr:LysM peptidoglycan-binding domain-containing protein [Lachnospiraceae bacterium]